ncbi:DUF1152 domain-containing protein [Patescibacteria group bacterium]
MEKSEKSEVHKRLSEKLTASTNPLILGVGGGNDSVSTLFLKAQLERDFGLAPDRFSIMAVLPDCLDYSGTITVSHPLIHEIGPESSRSVNGKPLKQFPERVLAENRERFQIEKVLGISMKQGSNGMREALAHYLENSDHDLILAFDVGGDFISVPRNTHVLSPMMDGYMMHALRSLQEKQDTPIIYGVFGLGTDGETPPELLHEALQRLPERFDGKFSPELIAPLERFYREVVEPNRYSRTADYTLKEIMGISHANPDSYRARLHTNPEPGQPSNQYYGYFQHHFDPQFFGSYHLFDNLQDVENPFEKECDNGIEWFVAVQDARTRINHELNGQSYDLGAVLKREELRGERLYFGTPSHKFSPEVRGQIIDDVLASVRNGVFAAALVYTEDILALNVPHREMTASVSIVSMREEVIDAIMQVVE